MPLICFRYQLFTALMILNLTAVIWIVKWTCHHTWLWVHLIALLHSWVYLRAVIVVIQVVAAMIVHPGMTKVQMMWTTFPSEIGMPFHKCWLHDIRVIFWYLVPLSLASFSFPCYKSPPTTTTHTHTHSISDATLGWFLVSELFMGRVCCSIASAGTV